VVSDVTDTNAGISTLKTYVVEAGRPGAIEAWRASRSAN
jgi:hypothetical protein